MATTNDDLEKMIIEVQNLQVEIAESLNEGFSINLPRKNGYFLFGAVICANVATVFTLQAITELTKRFVTKTDEEVKEDAE